MNPLMSSLRIRQDGFERLPLLTHDSVERYICYHPSKLSLKQTQDLGSCIRLLDTLLSWSLDRKECTIPSRSVRQELSFNRATRQKNSQGNRVLGLLDVFDSKRSLFASGRVWKNQKICSILKDVVTPQRSPRGKDGLEGLSRELQSGSKRSADSGTSSDASAHCSGQRSPVRPLAQDSVEVTNRDQKGSSDTWEHTTRPQLPLTSAEEVQYASFVQDLLGLEEKKAELEKHLGHTATEQEWANHVGVSVLHLYARIGRGRAAKRKMVEANLQLVHSVAQQFHGQGLTHSELCQEGILGLLKSTEKFDSTRKTKFSSYAFFWIKEQMGQAAKKFGRVLRIGQRVYRTASEILQHKDEFESEHGRQPTCEELSTVSKVDVKKIREVLRITTPVKSLDASESPSGESSDGRNPLFRQLRDTNPGAQPWLCVRDSEQRREVIRVLMSLKPREQEVMHLRYGLNGEAPHSRYAVSIMLGLHYETIRLVEKAALAKLRQEALDHGLLDYLSDTLWTQ